MDAFGDFEPEWATADPFGDPSEDDDGSEPKDDSEKTHFGAEHLLFLLDCDDSMFEQYVPCLKDDADDDAEQEFFSPMEVAVTAAHKFLRTKIRDMAETKSGKRDAFGVLLYGCDRNRAMRTRDSPKSNSSGDGSEGSDEMEDLPTTEELIELNPPGSEQVLKLQGCLPSKNSNQKQRNLRKEFSSRKSGGASGGEDDDDTVSSLLLQGLTAAMKIFAKSKHVKTPSTSSKQLPDSRAVWIFTNQDDPCCGDENQKTRMNTLKKDCHDAEIKIHLLPLPKNGVKREFDQTKFYNDLTTPYKRVEEMNSFADSSGAVDIDAILFNFDMSMRKRRKYASLPLLLPGWKEREDHPGIMLDLYSAVLVRNKPAKVAVHQEKNKMTTKKTRRYNTETSEVVEPEEVHHFADFCGRVPIQPTELGKMKKASNSQVEAGLVVHGFRKMRLLPKTNLVSRSVFVLANDIRVNGSGKTLYNLKQSMRKKGVFAVGELLTRASATSKMVAFVPKNDEYGGFFITQLPYKEDKRTVLQSDIGFADRTSIDAAKSLIEKSTLQMEQDFVDHLPENPWLKHFFGYLESVSLGRPLGRVEDDAKMDVQHMLTMASEDIQSLSLSLPEDDQPVKKERKRKAPSSSKPEIVKESITDEWIDLYKNDEVADCTANELKAFLKSQGERVAGKKSDLVDRVHRVIQKELFKE